MNCTSTLYMSKLLLHMDIALFLFYFLTSNGNVFYLHPFFAVHPDFFSEIVERKKANKIAAKKAKAAIKN